MLISSCEKKSIKQEETESEPDPKKLNNVIVLTTDIEKGRMVYFANCVSCHNNNPKKPGSIGPEVYGASIDVLTQKIVFGKYPENYSPKRTSKLMLLMPHLKKEISNLHAFINSF
jgi:cytochrome c2|tara:strand:+ start:210 stop:554 length:345 start_codon:yes stop_codon:yes gene_type:complete